MTSGITSFRSFDGIGSNIHVDGLDDLTHLYNSSSPNDVLLTKFGRSMFR